MSLAARIAAIPGVAQVRTRVVVQVTLDVPGLAEPATGRLVSIPEQPRPMLNDLHLRAGRYVEPGRDDEVIASEAFAAANGLKVGDSLGAVINGRWKRLRIVGIALSPEYVYEVGAGTIFPDNRRFGVLWMSETALALGLRHGGRLQRRLARAGRRGLARLTSSSGWTCCSPATAGSAPTAARISSRTASSPTRSRRTASPRPSCPASSWASRRSCCTSCCRA